MKINTQTPTWRYLRESYWLMDKLADSLDEFIPLLNSMIVKSKGYLKRHRPVLRFDPEKLVPNIFYGLLIIFLSYLTIFASIYYFEKDKGVRFVSILTGSMKPSISTGSLVITEQKEDYGVGDIITYQVIGEESGDVAKTVTHRITEKNDDGFFTKGDANAGRDENLVLNKRVLGSAVYIVPIAGLLLATMRTFPGFLAIIAIPATLLLRNEIRFLRKMSKENGRPLWFLNILR